MQAIMQFALQADLVFGRFYGLGRFQPHQIAIKRFGLMPTAKSFTATKH
jgi:hypothetical protein